MCDQDKPDEDMWDAFYYEIEMWVWSTKLNLELMQYETVTRNIALIRNALNESKVLHTRILVDILTNHKSKDDDFGISNLHIPFPDKANIQGLIDELKSVYGRGEDFSPWWIINKHLAHATLLRGSQYDYSKAIDKIEPRILDILNQVKLYCDRPKIIGIVNEYYRL